MWMGGGKGYENVVMVTLGTGVGGGIVIGGKIISGINGAGGELGHMQINAREKNVCGCGKCGHLEQYCSATGMVRVAKDMLKELDILYNRATKEPLFHSTENFSIFSKAFIKVVAVTSSAREIFHSAFIKANE
jgi:predicted NBD/HSP70 family sugar kinase